MELMENIKLLLAHADRRISNQIEVAVLDVCYDRAAVRSTRTARLDEFAHQGGRWDFDIIIVGADHLFRDRTQQTWATPDDVATAISDIRVRSSSPMVAYVGSEESGDSLLQAGADCVLHIPFESDQLKAELRSLLDLNEFVASEPVSRWSGLGSFLRGLQQAD
jgi:hypothetical protein